MSDRTRKRPAAEKLNRATAKSTALALPGQPERLILQVRGEKIILDADLARLFGVTTRRLNEQVKRNAARFPLDFMFRLTAEEKGKVVANCDHLAPLKFSKALPFAFTEHGAIMAASVLNSAQAVEASVFVVRAFVRLRGVLSTHRALAKKLSELETKVELHDDELKLIFETLRRLMAAPEKGKHKIGFGVKEKKGMYSASTRKGNP
jgi:hypothetical protein